MYGLIFALFVAILFIVCATGTIVWGPILEIVINFVACDKNVIA